MAPVSLLNPTTTWRIHERAESALLIDGRDYYRAFYAAVLQAKKSILLLGWQFDTDVQLLRGDDLPQGARPNDVALLAVIDRLCREQSELSAYVLAWDHSVFFALERQPLQKLVFDVTTCERFSFRWDNTVPLGGSHHQKVAIIDGRIAFFGSQDICQARWDDSSHRPDNEHRHSRGVGHQPYHEVQIALAGEPARSMVDLFVWRWYGATGKVLDVDRLVDGDGGRCGSGGGAASFERGAPRGLDFPVTLPMPRARIGLARTIPEVEGRAPVYEVRELFLQAVARAERIIYAESQYLTSGAVRDALVARMRDASRPKLEIVVILPYKPERFKEEVTVGVPQAEILQSIHEAATQHGHALGIYNVVSGADEDGAPLYVYIHSKLMIVDDRWFIVGSANLTNRSMIVDSEIVAAYEASREDRALRNAIRRARVRLLLEHAGGSADIRALVRPRGLVARLDAMASTGDSRLRKHDFRRDEPTLLAKTVHDLTFEILDPQDGAPSTGAATVESTRTVTASRTVTSWSERAIEKLAPRNDGFRR